MTQIAATYVDHMGSDLSVVNAARVSFGKKSEWENEDEVWVSPYIGEVRHEMMSPWVTPILSERDAKLIKYLAKHNHISPFGHAFASFHVKAPIFVARQLVKHKFLRWNEISRRYVDDEPVFYTPDVWRGRSADKKQGSDGIVNPKYNPQYLDDKIKYAYLQALDAGVAPEQARMLLPQSTLTEWYWSGSLDAFASMCNLRLKDDTQYETRLVAQQTSSKMTELFPVSWKALVE
jgi:thymidylate synthase (FAD)